MPEFESRSGRFALVKVMGVGEGGGEGEASMHTTYNIQHNIGEFENE
jgi:hypothetical protein